MGEGWDMHFRPPDPKSKKWEPYLVIPVMIARLKYSILVEKKLKSVQPSAHNNLIIKQGFADI